MTKGTWSVTATDTTTSTIKGSHRLQLGPAAPCDSYGVAAIRMTLIALAACMGSEYAMNRVSPSGVSAA